LIHGCGDLVRELGVLERLEEGIGLRRILQRGSWIVVVVVVVVGKLLQVL